MVKLIKRGILLRYADRIIHAGSSVTYIKCGEKNILVDTGAESERRWVIFRLEKNGISPEAIDGVVITHGHMDHTGNLEIFRNAEIYTIDSIKEFNSLFSPELTLIKTEGHTSDHISLISDSEMGKIVMAGDAIPTENNLLKLIPPALCENRKRSHRSMMEIVKIADFIIPGHGEIISNPHRQKKKKGGRSI